MREIVFYYTELGRCPIEDFLDSLSKKQVQEVTWVLKFIEENEHIPERYLKKLVNTEDIWEIRVRVASNSFRLLGFFENERLIILTHAFRKKTQKVPRKEIELAERRKKDHLSRKYSK